MPTAPATSSMSISRAVPQARRSSCSSTVEAGRSGVRGGIDFLAPRWRRAVTLSSFRTTGSIPRSKFPDFLMDGARALRWTHDNIAAFHGNPRRLFVMGHSAGAHIAAMLALDAKWLDEVGLQPNRDVAGLIGLSGPYDFLPLKDATLTVIFGGANRPVTQPISFAEGRKPPALLLTGATDDTVDPGNSTRLAEKLRRHGNDATEVVYPRLGHMTIMAALIPVLGRFFPLLHDMDAFIQRTRPSVEQRTGDKAALP